MRKEEKVTETIEKSIVTATCDICGGGIRHPLIGRNVCIICKRDMCNIHSIEEDGGGDYPSCYCPDCHTKYVEYKRIEREYEDKLAGEWDRIMKVKK